MPLKWEKVWISDERFETAGIFDVDNDGILDIVSGAYWYRGPDFREQIFIGEVMSAGEYYDDFSIIPMDVNGDGYLDFITGGWWGNTLRWRENSKGTKNKWQEHIIAEVGNVETTRGWDIDSDGIIEIIPNTPNQSCIMVFKLKTDMSKKGTGEFEQHIIYSFPEKQKQGHGLGCGNIAGNGRMDIVLCSGWLEAPAQPWKEPWFWHEEWSLPWRSASVPMLVVDVNGDGLNDIIVGNAHGYGLLWLEQQRNINGTRTWIQHSIDPYNAPYHDMAWIDIDNDGECELVTGKRHRTHCRNDPGEWDDVGIYYFKWTGEGFVKQIIDYGPIGKGKGCGIHFAIADLNHDGRLDIVFPEKMVFTYISTKDTDKFYLFLPRI